MKYYKSEEILKQFHKLSNKNKVYVLLSALSYMQQYNGRSEIYCIALALGYDNDTGNYDTYYKSEKT